MHLVIDFLSGVSQILNSFVRLESLWFYLPCNNTLCCGLNCVPSKFWYGNCNPQCYCIWRKGSEGGNDGKISWCVLISTYKEGWDLVTKKAGEQLWNWTKSLLRELMCWHRRKEGYEEMFPIEDNWAAFWINDIFHKLSSKTNRNLDEQCLGNWSLGKWTYFSQENIKAYGWHLIWQQDNIWNWDSPERESIWSLWAEGGSKVGEEWAKSALRLHDCLMSSTLTAEP